MKRKYAKSILDVFVLIQEVKSDMRALTKNRQGRKFLNSYSNFERTDFVQTVT